MNQFTSARAKPISARLSSAIGGIFLSLASLSASAAIVDTGPVNIAVPNTIDGIYMNIVSGAQGSSGLAVPGWDLNFYAGSSNLQFFTSNAVGNNNQIVLAAGVPAALTGGVSVGPVSTFNVTSTLSTAGTPYRTTGTWYVGFRFTNEATAAINYGYVQLQTTSATGFPATIKRIVYENTGLPVTIPSTFTNITGTMGGAVTNGSAYSASAGSQTGRINRDGIASSCVSPKAPASLAATTGARQYHAYTFTNSTGFARCYAVSNVAASGTNIFTAVYSNSGFVPATPNVNYLADVGSSDLLQRASFLVQPGESFTVVVHDVNTTPSATSYTLKVSLDTPLDLSGDSKSDLLTRDAAGVLTARLMNGTTVISTATLLAAGPNWTVTHTGDLNGDGRTDLIFRNNSDGSVVIYLMNGLTIQSSATMLAGGSPWRVAHVADVDGDGKADILWRNTSDNSHAIWRMDGLTILAGSGGIVNAGPWLADQVGDFNGDGKADILWRNTTDGSHAIWLMNGITVLPGSGGILGAGPWVASHIADFNGDGKSDILWRNTTDGGTVAMWTMNGIAVTGGGTIIGAGVWQATHVGDLDGDGKADILWRNTSDGTIAAWLMNGQTITSGTSIIGANSGWTVQKLLDLNGDGKADIVWRNTDGTIAVWLMNGLSLTSGATIVGPGTTAQVVP